MYLKLTSQRLVQVLRMLCTVLALSEWVLKMSHIETENDHNMSEFKANCELEMAALAKKFASEHSVMFSHHSRALTSRVYSATYKQTNNRTNI